MPGFWNVRYGIHKLMQPIVKEIKGLRAALSCQCQNSAYVVRFFSGTVYIAGDKFLQVIYESFDSDFNTWILSQDFKKYLYYDKFLTVI